MKGGREHRVPLSDDVVALLRELPRDAVSEAVFPGRSAGGFLNQDAMADVLAKLRPGITVHGFRSSFRTWAEERARFPRDLAEEALAHRLGNATERAYRRTDMLEERRPMMAAWAAYCETGKVVPFRVAGGEGLARENAAVARSQSR
jgi:integrase